MLIDDGGRVTGEHCACDLRILDAPSRLPEEAVNVGNPHARDNPLEAHPSVLAPQVGQEVVLEFIRRGKVGVTSLAGPRGVACPVPEQPGFTESRPRCDHAPVSRMRT